MQEATAPTATAVIDDETRVAMVEVPLLERDVYVGRKLRDLDFRHAATLTAVMNALAADAAKLQSGRVVQTPDDALVWILERIAESHGAGG
jgi:Trk K+ transport system NAD-binding subunit